MTQGGVRWHGSPGRWRSSPAALAASAAPPPTVYGRGREGAAGGRYEAASNRAVPAGGGAAVSYVVADTTQPDQVQRFVQTAVERYGGVDVFLANAGIEGVVQPIPEYPMTSSTG